EIDRELRRMEEWVVERGDATQVGENLIADALGPDALFRRFSPIGTGVGFPESPTQLPTRSFPRLGQDHNVPPGREPHTGQTQSLDRNRGPPAKPAPKRRHFDPAFHNATTQIIRPEERRKREEETAPSTRDSRKPRGR